MSSGQHRPADDLGRSDIEALGATRAELGADYENALLESFADRVEKAIDERVSGELARRGGYGQGVSGQYSQQGYHVSQRSAPPGSGAQLALGIVSTVALIPISIVLGVTGNWFAMLLAVAAILGVNAAHAFHLRQQDPRGR